MITDIIIKAFLGACGTGLLTLMVLLIKLLWQKFKADSLTMKALAHDAYFRQARYILTKEFVTEEELENHNYLYRAYKLQKLNGTGDRLHQQILDMKLVTGSPEWMENRTK